MDAQKANDLFDSKMQNVVNFDEVPSALQNGFNNNSKPANQDNNEPDKIDFFGGGLDDDDQNDDVMNPDDFDQLEKDFNDDDSNKNTPFGQSITKDVLQQSKREAIGDLASKKNLEIEIDDNDDYNTQNEKVQQNLNDQLQKMEDHQNTFDGAEEVDEQDIIKEFANLYDNDPELQQMLGEYPDRYTLEEKLSIIQAYKKGGGVQGLAEIIDDEDEEDDQMANGAQGGQGGNVNQNVNVQDSNDQGEEEEENVDIDLEDPEDVKLIEQEFRKLYERDDDFKNNFGEEAFELDPLQKYQIIDAYNKNGMEAVLALLTASADQSGILPHIEANGISDMDIQGADESIIEHNGKKYQKIQIEGLGDDEEYLMDANGDIYSLDFKLITNMGDNVIIEEQ